MYRATKHLHFNAIKYFTFIFFIEQLPSSLALRSIAFVCRQIVNYFASFSHQEWINMEYL